MGKAKKKGGHKRSKEGKPAVNPITNESVQTNEMENGNEFSKVDHLDNIMATICGTAEIEQRECGLASFANLAQEREAVMKMLQKGIVKKLGPLLAEVTPEIKEKVAGTFRNMSVTGGAEACEMMVKHDIMTSVACAIKKDILEIDHLRKSGSDVDYLAKLYSSLKELVILLWNLCETSSLAVNLFNQDQLLMPVASLLHTENTDPLLMVASAQCLYTITEDNKDAIAMLISNSEFLRRLSELQSQKGNAQQMLIAALCSGILYNLHKALPESAWDQIIEKVMCVISQALEVKPLEVLQHAMVSSKEESEKENILDYLSGQQICLELLANVLCSDDDEDWEDMEVTSEDDIEDNVEEVQMSMDIKNSATAVKSDLPLFKLLLGHSIPSKILMCVENVNKDSISVVNDPEMKERLLKAYQRVQKSALVCFNNLLSECPTYVIGDSSCLESVWTKVMFLATTQQDEIDEELIDGYTGLLRSVAVKMAEANNYKFLSPETMEIFEGWNKTCISDSTKCNLLSILGVAGKFVAQNEDGLAILEGIGRILLSAVNINNSVIVITEALDAVFDAFAEGGIADAALVSTGLAKELRRLPPLLKTKIKAEKHQLKEHLPVIDMARTNLVRFIKYKQWK